MVSLETFDLGTISTRTIFYLWAFVARDWITEAFDLFCLFFPYWFIYFFILICSLFHFSEVKLHYNISFSCTV